MLDSEIYAKTDLGRTEITTRAMKLSPALRSTLLVVDGHRTVVELRDLATRLHAPADALDQLSRVGLIARSAHNGVAVAEHTSLADVANRYVTLHGLMSEAVRADLGLRGYFMQLRIERCADATELAALLPELTSAVAKARGGPYAAQWEQGVRAATVA